MKILFTAILFLFPTLFFVNPSHAIENTVASSTAREPKYSEVKKMNNFEVSLALRKYIGTKDTWKRGPLFINKLESLIPFQKKRTLQEEIKNLSYIYAKKGSSSLLQYVRLAQESKYSEIQSTVAIVRGDKRLALESYENYSYKRRPSNSMLYFFKTLDYGDTGYENKKFIEFAFGFENLAKSISIAYQNSAKLNVPMVLEFESSSLIDESPITKLFYRSLVNHPEHLLHTKVTPSNGRLVFIHPFYAQNVAQNFHAFAEQFKKRVHFDSRQVVSDREIRQRLVDTIRYGDGVAKYFHLEENNLKENNDISLNAEKENRNLTCSQFFN